MQEAHGAELGALQCPLPAALGDGPRTPADALAMCRIAAEQGIRHVAALAHQSERWALTPAAIREAVGFLAILLAAEQVPLTVYPTAEVMASPDLVENWKAGRLLSIADR